MRKVSVIGSTVSGVLLLILVAEAMVYAANIRTRHQAEALLRDMRKMIVGHSSTADVLRIARSYPAALPGSSSSCAFDESHSIRIANDIINRLGFAVPALRTFGIRPSGIVAMFLLKNGRLCYMSYTFAVEVSNLGLEAVTTERIFDCNANSTQYPTGCYWVDQGAVRLNRELTAELSSVAKSEEREHAFAFDLSCLTTMRGCQKLCEMNPSVWRDYLATARTESRTLPPEINDPRCRAVESSRL